MPIGVFASSTGNALDIIACYVNPDTGEKKIIKRQKMKDQTNKITKVISDELLSAMDNDIDDYKV
jgi:porphobilinogen deaminase